MHTNKTPYICEICSKRFSRIGNPKENFHTYTNKRLCEICSEEFSQSSHQKEQLHTNIKEKSCEICSKVFSWCGHLKGFMCTHTLEKLLFVKYVKQIFEYAADTCVLIQMKYFSFVKYVLKNFTNGSSDKNPGVLIQMKNLQFLKYFLKKIFTKLSSEKSFMYRH